MFHNAVENRTFQTEHIRSAFTPVGLTTPLYFIYPCIVNHTPFIMPLHSWPRPLYTPCRVDLLLTTSSLLLTVLRDAILYRHNNIHMYQVPDTPRDHTHTMPPHEAVYWTSSDDMRSVLKQQVDLLMSVGETEAGEQVQS